MIGEGEMSIWTINTSPRIMNTISIQFNLFQKWWGSIVRPIGLMLSF